MEILNEKQINQKIKRLAIEIIENNYDEKSIYLAGVNNTGALVAKMLEEELKRISNINIISSHIRLNPANPLGSDIVFQTPIQELKNQTIIVVDDVASTGRTLFYACKPILETLPKKLETVVLVNRTHKSFPIEVNYVGISLATTLMENINVHIKKEGKMAVYLE